MVDNPPMNLQRDRRRSPRNSIHNPLDSSGHRGGRARMVDLSETGSYVHITFRMSEELRKRFKLAVTIEDTTQVEFIISALEPKIDEVLAEAGF